MDYIYKEQVLNISIDVFRGQSAIKEDFSRAELKVFLVCGVEKKRKVIDAIVDDYGSITFSLKDLIPGVYGVKLIWRKNSERVPLYAELYNMFGITEYAEEATNPTKLAANLRAKLHSATYGNDGLDAYELAVLRGKTKASEDEWLQSRGVTATVQQEGDDEDSVMSQAAVTSALRKLRNTIGAGCRLKGKVDVLPAKADIGDLYLFGGHTWGCIGKEDSYRVELGWKFEDGSKIESAIINSYLYGLDVNTPTRLPVRLPEGVDFEYYCVSLPSTRETKFYIYPCDAEGNILMERPLYARGDELRWTEIPNENYVLCGRVVGEKHIDDAIWQDFGELNTIDYTPKARDTEFTPSEGSMLNTDNVQQGLDVMGLQTPSLELNLVTANNINADVINANFEALRVRYNKLLDILQALIDNVSFNSPNGFRDVKEMISGIDFGKVNSVYRVTTGGSLGEHTSISREALSGEAISGTI